MPTPISKPSFQSLFVQVKAFEKIIGTATAFVVLGPRGQPFLITNWHVVSGRHHDTHELLCNMGAIPDTLIVWHNATTELGHFVEVLVPLYRDDKPTWFAHPIYGDKVDVVAIPIEKTSDILFYPYDLAMPNFMVQPGQRLSVVGFPFGERTARSFALWSTGFIASEPEIDHGGRPLFLIDCRAREGQSGSAVIFHAGHPHDELMTKEERLEADLDIHFFGIYSGRINKESDLGYVWRPRLITETVLMACCE